MPAVDPALVSLVSVATALTASLFGPLVALYVARAQIRATVRSANRQRWIDEFRDTVAAFCGQVAAATQLRDTLLAEGRVRVQAGGDGLERFERVVATSAKIRLLVNPTDPDHRNLVAAVDALLALFASAPPGEDIQARARSMALAITDMSLAVIRREWACVLRGA